MLSFTVMDNKGKYVNGLKHADFRILEDGIQQKLSTFSEGNQPPVEITPEGVAKPIVIDPAKPDVRTDAFVGTNVFVLFDTSNYMYRTFVYASEWLLRIGARPPGPGAPGMASVSNTNFAHQRQ